MLQEFKVTVFRNKWNIILLAFLMVAFPVAINKNLMSLNVSFEKGDHFNILTINSILAGFLFTGLGIMISGLSKDRIARLEDGGYLDKYYFAVYTSILLNILSIVSSILLIFNIAPKLKYTLIYWEQVGLIAGVIFFIKCMYNLRKIINKMRKSKDAK